MDNHPIPQDVTNFQFRLIGEMTLKQFGYVAGGVICAWVMLASPLFFPLKLLVSGGCVLAGIILAFVPVDGRPSDIMVVNFIKALFNPTQFIYQKGQQNTTPIQNIPTVTPPPQNQPKKEEKKEETVQIHTLTQVATAAVEEKKTELEEKKETQPVETNIPAPQVDSTKEALLEGEVAQLYDELKEAKEQEKEDTGTQEEAATHQKVVSLETTLQELMQQKQDLEKKLIELQKALTQKNQQQVYAPSVAKPQQETDHVRKIPKQMAASTGTPLVPETPNLITGVIKDPRGNVQPNILIEVKDKDGNPVRAFKTNQLGQFAAATPLVDGLYTISFEDPSDKQTFDSVEITADGSILLPLEIISVDEREKLRKELFGK